MHTQFINVKKILVIKLRHIGDVLLTVPVFRALKNEFPDSHVAAMVLSGTEEVLTGNPMIDEIIVYTKKHSVLSMVNEEVRFLRKLREKNFDMAVALTSGDRAAIVSLASGARYRLSYDPRGKGFPFKRNLYTHRAQKRDCHTVIKNLEVLRQFGISTNDASVEFFIDERSRKSARKYFTDYGINENDLVVHIHPVARLFHKCWKDEYFAEVIKWLAGRDIKVVITSSPDRLEVEKTNKILSLAGCPDSVLALNGKTTLKELAAISGASSLFIGVDSAPMHIAAAVGTPVIALFGHGEKRWRPWGDNHIVISKNSGTRNGKSQQEHTKGNMDIIKPEDVIIELEKKGL